MALHSFWLVIFIIYIARPCFLNKGSVVGKDSIAFAQEIGRLDIVSILLAFLGIIIALGAFLGFGWIRNDAMNEARETVTDRAGDLIKETLHENPKLIEVALSDVLLNREIKKESLINTDFIWEDSKLKGDV